MQNSFITLPEAQVILRPRARSLANALRKTIDAWNNELAPAQMVLDPAARAMNLSRYFYFNSNGLLTNDPGVRFSNRRNQRYFTFDERIILRFKLLDKSFKSSNYPTRTARKWNSQLFLAGMPPCERLEFGYRLDLTGTVVQDAFILLRVCTEVTWLWQVWGPPIDVFPIQLSLTPIGQTQTVFAYDDYSKVV
jgi:hypothetical protein